MNGEPEGHSKEDLDRDLAAFSALIDSDDDFEAECLSQESRKSVRSDKETPAASDTEELDYDAISSMLECSDDDDDDDDDDEKKQNDGGASEACPKEPSQDEINDFLGGEDSEEESELESSQEPVIKDTANLSAEDVMSALDENSSEPKKEETAPPAQQTTAETDPSVGDFMDEYRKMEAMMELMRAKRAELEQKGLVPNNGTETGLSPPQNKPPLTEKALKKSTSESPSLTKEQSRKEEIKPASNIIEKPKPTLKDLNMDIFSSHTEEKKSSPAITKPGRPRKRPGVTLNVDEIKPTNFYSKPTAGASLAGDDDDSDWEDMDGEKPNSLSTSGENLKRIMKRSDGSRLAHRPTDDSAQAKNEKGSTSKPAPSGNVSLPVKKVEDNSWKDPFSGMKIVKPLVSEQTMASRMEGRRLIRMSKISNHQRKSLQDVDWVTVGCIVGKSETRTSAKGSQYMIWTLSDLEECDNSVKLFLFGDTYKQLWKESVGTVVGVLNPNFLANEEKASTGVALTVDNWQKIMKLGMSRDHGVCKATTKSGKTCFNYINKSQGEYCTYHVQSAYKKACSKRSELQAGYSGPKPKSFMNKIFNKKNDTYYYGGQMFTMEGNTGNKNAVTASSIRNAAQSGKKSAFTLSNLKSDDQLLAGLNASTSQAALQEKLALPTRGSMNLLKHLSKEERREKEKSSGQKIVHVKPSELMRQNRREFNEQKQARKENLLNDPAPRLGRGFEPGMEISLDGPTKMFSPSGGKTMSKTEAAARLRAPLAKTNPNAVKKKTSPEAQKRVRKRLADAMTPAAPQDQGALSVAKRPKILGGLDLQSEEVQKMLKAGSSHKGAVAEIEADREENYFAGLEKQETMEQKMLSIKEIKVSVVTCKVCKYTVDGKPNPTCLSEHKHALVHSKTNKKFYKCTGCGERTTSFDKYPGHPCTKCGGNGFEKTSMWKERKGPKLDSEKLLLRGEERTHINS